MKRILVALLVGGVLLATAFGAAAYLPVDGGTIQTGSDVVLGCDPNGVDVDGWGFPWGNPPVMVNYVRVKDIHPDCATCDMMVLITDGDGNTIAWGAARKLTGTDEVKVYFGAASDQSEGPVPGPVSVPALDIKDIHITVEGPCLSSFSP